MSDRGRGQQMDVILQDYDNMGMESMDQMARPYDPMGPPPPMEARPYDERQMAPADDGYYDDSGPSVGPGRPLRAQHARVPVPAAVEAAANVAEEALRQELQNALEENAQLRMALQIERKERAEMLEAFEGDIMDSIENFMTTMDYLVEVKDVLMRPEGVSNHPHQEEATQAAGELTKRQETLEDDLNFIEEVHAKRTPIKPGVRFNTVAEIGNLKIRFSEWCKDFERRIDQLYEAVTGTPAASSRRRVDRAPDAGQRAPQPPQFDDAARQLQYPEDDSEPASSIEQAAPAPVDSRQRSLGGGSFSQGGESLSQEPSQSELSKTSSKRRFGLFGSKKGRK
ncbi:unnamed protein product [Pedinophyceae sp. YPF-701]|nr:unnamed protein product [Pedinophyceae sp. YPF-701]